MDKVFGKKVRETVINMKDNTQMIKKTVMEYLHGHLVTYIKEIIKQI
jgi:hypothetical protein